MAIGRLAHVAIGAGDGEAELLRFYGSLFGVVEVARGDGVAYLSGGRKPAYDIAIVPGEPGLHHIAFEVDSGEDLARARESLGAGAIAVEQLDVSSDHGIAAGIGFALPSGHAFELVELAEPAVFRGTPTVPERHFAGAGPVELEHVTIDCNDVAETVELLQARLGLRNTEYSQPPGGPWFLAFMRSTDLHHDLGVFRHDSWDGPGFNHVGFAVPSILEIARVADLACARGFKLQYSPGRHLVGDNIFAYLLDPTGNRVEVGTPMTKVAPSAPTRAFDASGDSEWGGFDAWRTDIPADVRAPGRCVDARR